MVISRVIIGVTPFRVLIALLITYIHYISDLKVKICASVRLNIGAKGAKGLHGYAYTITIRGTLSNSFGMWVVVKIGVPFWSLL